MSLDSTYSTIVSLLPFTLCELKPGLNPNEYIINPARGMTPGLTIIPNDVYYLVNPDPLADAKDVRQIKVPVPSIELAQAIITDYISALLGATPPDAQPGLIACKGDFTDPKELSKVFMKELMVARVAQNRWFQNLVDIADDLWAKTRSPISISDLQREAANQLGLKRDWLSPLAPELQVKCPFCQNPINPGAIKCVTCHEILDRKEYDKLMAVAK